jgi:YhhN-like protein.
LVVAEFVALALVVLPRVNHLMEFVFVVMYMIVIALMGGMSVLNNYTARYMLIIASQLFIISDSLIAVSRFVTHIPNAGFLDFYSLIIWRKACSSGVRSAYPERRNNKTVLEKKNDSIVYISEPVSVRIISTDAGSLI